MAKRTDFTHEQVNFIISQYKSKNPLMDIAQTLGLKSIKAVQRVLRMHGFNKFSNTDSKRILKAEEVVALYESGITQQEVCKKVGLAKKTVLTILREHGVEIRPRTLLRKHAFREDAFDAITEESAYWMGFLMADGYVFTDGGKHRIALHISQKDIMHLEKLKTWLGATHPITTRTNFRNNNPSTISSFCFSSKRAVDTLAKHGIVTRKSMTAKVHGELAMNRHFWRGVIDGDGCLNLAKDGKPTLLLCGSKDMVEQFRTFALTIVPSFRNKIGKSGKNLFRVNFCSNNAVDIVRHLYDGCIVALERKLEKAKLIISQYKSKKRRSFIM